ncbi:uncharacterized protein LOC108097520 [Drosophila ficusphila]|uniref:uncharacterized protein LOC108097520 n=1 Tax=Drosophila ficusphila TaxID=30025 RepID=UPI0007E5CD60|nr:uncharacterized protein LOC108097520 [Drosophila ficusphila]
MNQTQNLNKSLNLLDKTLPISVVTAPELRARRQFSFNGLQYEMSGLLPRPPPQQMRSRFSRLRAGGVELEAGKGKAGKEGLGAGVGVSKERMQSVGSSQIIASKSFVESAGGDGGPPSADQKRVLPKRVHLGERASPTNAGIRMPRVPSELELPKEVSRKPQSIYGSQTDLRSKRMKYEEDLKREQYREHLRRERKERRKQIQMELEGSKSYESAEGDLAAQQSWLLAQSLLRAYGSGLVQSPAGEGSAAKMDYITLAGLVLGCLASHVLFLLCWYFSWLKNQAVGMRRRFLGNANLWEFFDLEDTSRYSVQTKLVLAPLIVVCGLLYCVVNMLHLVVQVVRSDVPRTVVVFVQRVANSGLIGTIAMALAGIGIGVGGAGGEALRGRQQKPAMS